MARVCFLVTVLIHMVFANDAKIKNCNDCIKVGGSWCNKLNSDHCVFSRADDWCPDDEEHLPTIEFIDKPGKLLIPVYAERTLYIGSPSRLDISYDSPVKLGINLTIINTTQNFNIDVKELETICKDSECTATVEATPRFDFCSKSGTTKEYIFVKIKFGNGIEEALVKYHVPCACECSLKVERKSRKCNERGDFSCGLCACQHGWSGESCDKPICDDRRGDVQCSGPPKSHVECSGNGYCGPCESCVCYTDRDGSQFFDQDNYCADICMVTSECDTCLKNSTPGECPDCLHPMAIRATNRTLLEDRDWDDRKVWVQCNETVDDCYVEYAATKTETGQMLVMVLTSCNDRVRSPYVGGTSVPMILGILGLLAAVMAVGGVLAWKHFNTVPPLPLSDPEYQNIDAEDCTGENPLYKSPMSSFKNPTYGKW